MSLIAICEAEAILKVAIFFHRLGKNREHLGTIAKIRSLCQNVSHALLALLIIEIPSYQFELDQKPQFQLEM